MRVEDALHWPLNFVAFFEMYEKTNLRQTICQKLKYYGKFNIFTLCLAIFQRKQFFFKLMMGTCTD